ncbi:MAG: hypothetical protein R2991_13095 [Thermoanaerobaculia bacterium]
MSDASSRATRLDRWAPILVLLTASAWGLWCRSRLAESGIPFALPLDDSWIHLQFARNIAEGAGLAYRAPEWVAGSTAPLWTALLAIGSALGVPLGWARLLGVACLAATADVVRRLGLAMGLGRGLAGLAALGGALAGPLLWGAFSGLEIPLFTLLSLLGIRLHLADRATGGLPRSLPVLALAVLARPEGWLLLGLAILDRLFEAARRSALGVRLGPTLAGLGTGLLAVGPVCLFSLAVSGSPFPSTLAAKSAGWAWWPEPASLAAAARLLLAVAPLAAPLAVAGLALSLTPARRARSGPLPAAWLIGLPVALSMIRSPAGPLLGNFGRYLYPLVPLVVLFAAVLLQALVDVAGSRPTVLRLAGAVAAVLLLVPTAASWAPGARLFVHNVRDVEAGDGSVARWLAQRVPDDAVLAVHDVGRIGYEVPNPLVDLAGILNADVRAALRRGRMSGRWQEELLAVLERRRPDYLVVFPRFVPFVEAPGVSFRLLHEVEIPGNITMGDDRIAVYSTPWTRRARRGDGR